MSHESLFSDPFVLERQHQIYPSTSVTSAIWRCNAASVVCTGPPRQKPTVPSSACVWWSGHEAPCQHPVKPWHILTRYLSIEKTHQRSSQNHNGATCLKTNTLQQSNMAGRFPTVFRNRWFSQRKTSMERQSGLSRPSALSWFWWATPTPSRRPAAWNHSGSTWKDPRAIGNHGEARDIHDLEIVGL